MSDLRFRPRPEICTAVFPPDLKPARIGVYYSPFPYAGFTYWDGAKWSPAEPTAGEAFRRRRHRAATQDKRWYGMRWPSLKVRT